MVAVSGGACSEQAESNSVQARTIRATIRSSIGSLLAALEFGYSRPSPGHPRRHTRRHDASPMP